MRTSFVESMGPWLADDEQDPPQTSTGTKAEPTRGVKPETRPEPQPKK